MLLGYRIRQQSILWPLVAVMLPGWLVLVSLVRRPAADLHTQLALRARVEQQMLAYDYATFIDSASGVGSLPGRRAQVESLYGQAHQAGLIKDAQLVDEAVVWQHFGDYDRAARTFAEVQKPGSAGLYYSIVQKVLHGPLTDKETENLRTLRAAHPKDWWLNTLAYDLHLPEAVRPSSPGLGEWPYWRLGMADDLPLALGVLAMILALPAFRILRGTWTIWPYSERIQRLWPLALMLFVLSLRGLFLLLGTSVARIVVPLVSWAGQRDAETVYHIQNCLGFLFSMVVLAATTYGVKESVALHWGSLGDVLGFERKEFRNWRLWRVAIPCAAALFLAVQPLPGLLEQWHIGGPSIYDSLSRSPAGYNSLGMLLSVALSVAIGPFFEEIIYRGFLLSALRNCFGPLLGILLSSGLFALAHGSSLAGTITAFAYGIVYASIKLHTGRISVAILLHACVGIMQTTLLLLQDG